jgi:anti-sigma B factor antagonist
VSVANLRQALWARTIGAACSGHAWAQIVPAPTTPSLIAAEVRTIVELIVSGKAAVGNARARREFLPSAQPGNPYSWGSIAMAVTSRIHVSDADGVTLIRFHDNQLFDERTVREASDQIAAALPNDGSPIRLVVDFSDVGLISSTFLSKLILLQRRIDQTRGKLRLCEMSQIIQQVFRTSNLDRLFKIDRDQRTAIDSFQ